MHGGLPHGASPMTKPTFADTKLTACARTDVVPVDGRELAVATGEPVGCCAGPPRQPAVATKHSISSARAERRVDMTTCKTHPLLGGGHSDAAVSGKSYRAELAVTRARSRAMPR